MNRLQKFSVAGVALLATFTPPGVIVFAAFEHNPQNEFIRADGTTEWQAVLGLALPYLLLGCLFACLVTGMLIFLIAVYNQWKLKGDR